jgi:serine/threonine protein kinase
VSLYKWKPGAKVNINGESVERSGLVAVKSLLPSAAHNEQAIADFKAEMSMLSRLSHSCLVGSIGTGVFKDAKTGEDLLFLAMEAVTGGDLRNAVLKAMEDSKAYNDADIVRWTHDIARGLHYLHTRSPMIIHRDLKVRGAPMPARLRNRPPPRHCR